MAVYVDALGIKWRGWKWCHIYGDTQEELHDFAKQMKLKKEWYQDPSINKCSWPHYDMLASKQPIALKEGATLLTRNEAVAKYKEIKAKYIAGVW